MSGVFLEVESSNGNLNLSPYLDVQEGQGMDPADPQFTSKVFAHSLLKVGGTLALEDFKVRELTFPLTLKAASKDALTALVRSINAIINTAGAEVEWSDEGTSVSTFFQLASGQCDPEFDFRQGQQTAPMLKAKLRLFVQPFGALEPGTRTLALAAGATNQASTPVLVYYPASPVRGDAPALLKTVLNLPGASGSESPPYWYAMSVLPASSYQPWMPAASATIAKASSWLSGASGGYSYLTGQGSTSTLTWAPPGSYSGSRVLAIARRLNNASPASLTFTPTRGEAIQAATVPAASPWAIIDLGVFTAGPHAPAFTAKLNVQGATVTVYGLVMLPDNQTVWGTASSVNLGNVSSITFNGQESRAYNGFGEELTQVLRGNIPTYPAATPAQPLAFFLLSSDQKPPVVEGRVEVQERTRYVF